MMMHPDDVIIGQRFRKADDDEIKGLAESIRELGQLQPARIGADGKLVCGLRRLQACKLLGRDLWVEPWDGGDNELARMKAERAENVERRPFTPSEAVAMGLRFEEVERPRAEERRKATQNNDAAKTSSGKLPELVKDKGETRAKAAEAVGMSPRTYDKAKAVVQAAAAPDAPPEVVAAKEAMDASGKVDPAYRAVTRHVVQTGSSEWYTPAPIIASARAVLGEIDLDPASSPVANETVRATEFFDEKADGLLQHWAGRVWLNPPYASGMVEPFVGRLKTFIESSDIQAAVLLVNNATETGWFQSIAPLASAGCFPRGRIRFNGPDGKPVGQALQGQVILYFGDEDGLFTEEFKQHGTCFVGCRA